jgi:Protein of unknown function (DUF3105)
MRMVVLARVVHSRVMHWWWWLAVVGALACGDDDILESGGMDGATGPQRDLDAMLTLDAHQAEAGGDAGNVCRTRMEQLAVAEALQVTGDVVYADPPPVGGNHNECWAKWGVHKDELADERWVHNLERGGVVFLYRCPDNSCRDEVDTLQVFVGGRTQALVTPYAALPTRFAVVAWGVRLTTNCFDMPAFQSFYDAHVDRAPESLSDNPPRSCK